MLNLAPPLDQNQFDVETLSLVVGEQSLRGSNLANHPTLLKIQLLRGPLLLKLHKNELFTRLEFLIFKPNGTFIRCVVLLLKRTVPLGKLDLKKTLVGKNTR